MYCCIYSQQVLPVHSPRENQLEPVSLRSIGPVLLYQVSLNCNIGTLPQDPNSTLGHGSMYKKGLSSSVDELISSTPSNYELKTDLNPVSDLTETETKIDLSSVKPPVNVSHVQSAKVTDTPLSTQKMPCDEAKSAIDPTNDGSGMTPDSILKVTGGDDEA